MTQKKLNLHNHSILVLLGESKQWRYHNVETEENHDEAGLLNEEEGEEELMQREKVRASGTCRNF